MAYSGFDLSGKVAFVTGASRGMGRAIALGLAECGAQLFLCSRTLSDLRAVARELQALRQKAEVAAVDVRSIESIEAGVGSALRTFGQIDILINIGSTLGVVGAASRSVYSMTKGGVTLLTKALALEWAPFNVHVNAIGPTLIRTDMSRFIQDDPVAFRQMVAKIPLGRAGEVQDVVGAAIYLASPASDLVTGHILMADGGWTAQ